MIYTQFYICILAITSLTDAIKVNMHGSFSFGKDVMKAVRQYLRMGSPPLKDSRRSLNTTSNFIEEVKSASLCENLNLCKGNLEEFVKDYTVELAQAVEQVFLGILDEKTESNLITESFNVELKSCLNDVRKILKSANKKVPDEPAASIWVGVVKKINAKYQNKSIAFIEDKFNSEDPIIKTIKRKVTQSLVINIAAAEIKAQNRLCYEFDLCLNSVSCTSFLNVVFRSFSKLTEGKLKSFVKDYYEGLPDAFFANLSPVTGNEFKDILSDIVVSDYIKVKFILASLQEIVETRLKTLHTTTPLEEEDSQLINTILSDMDYLYSNKNEDHLKVIQNDFLEWAKDETDTLPTTIKDAIENIEAALSSAPKEIVLKLINEVRTFLEITVDPEN